MLPRLVEDEILALVLRLGLTQIELDGDKLSYSETTVLEIYGKKFDHIDENELTRC